MRQFRIERIEDPSDPDRGAPGFGWREFMEKAKPEVLRIMRENRQMKVNMILSCEMVRENEDGSVQL